MDILSWKMEDFEYTKCYCEENIWKLCEKFKGNQILKRSYVVFVSNDKRQIPLWKQSASTQEEMGHVCVWDYHVILLVKADECPYIVDFDTLLGFVSRFDVYYDLAIRDEEGLPDFLKRKFRVIPAASFLEKFASDRSHMMRTDDAGNTSYISPPPAYDPIRSADSTNNIEEFISMSLSNEYGQVLDQESFLSFSAMKDHCNVASVQ